MSGSQAPTGLARRGRRLTDQETEQRMLRAAVAMISSTGLTVSLEHISLEEIIREAGVARSTVYRRWPHKDLFFSDLVRELASGASPAILAAEEQLIRQIAAQRPDWLDTASGRQELVAELFRQLSAVDFQSMSGSPAWRTYLALHATYLSLTGDDLRREVQDALAASGREHIDRVAVAWAHLAGLLGYRLRPELGVGFTDLAALLDATMRGLVIMVLSLPELAGERFRAQPFGADRPADWSLPALGLAGLASSFLEPDPDVSWDANRIAVVRQALVTVSLPAS